MALLVAVLVLSPSFDEVTNVSSARPENDRGCELSSRSWVRVHRRHSPVTTRFSVLNRYGHLRSP